MSNTLRHCVFPLLTSLLIARSGALTERLKMCEREQGEVEASHLSAALLSPCLCVLCRTCGLLLVDKQWFTV